MKTVVIYTDGACRGNPGPGGWGALMEYKGEQRELWGGEANTTNNRMEMLAAIHALERLKECCCIELYTDSNYLRQGVTQWLARWKRNGWRTAARQPVKNKDLWQSLDDAAQGHELTWHWVKGHAGNHGNERGDALANHGIDEMMAAK